MSESEKPFACPSPGCNMSFVNEDHLTVHRKRHEMILNLGSNGKAVGAFVADQTPTPTRFIRNCEEVGLFQDLQNVNPFEETFRRAVEAGKTGSLAIPEVGISDDTLHTPHIFPHIVDDPSSTNNNTNNNNNNNNNDNNDSDSNRDLLVNGVSDPPVISITDSTDEDVNKNTTNIEIRVEEINCDDNSNEKLKTVELDTDSQDDSIVETIVVQEAGTSISTTVLNLRNNHQQKTSPQLSINGKEVQLLMKTEDGKLMQLSAVPVSQSEINPTTVNIQSNTQTVVIKTEPSLNYSEKKKKIVESTSSTRLSLAKMKLKQALTKNGVSPEIQEDTGQWAISQTNNNGDNNQVIDVTKKQDILERNRASSMRARAKRKAWIQQLERSVYNVNETNAVLQLEVRALRSEVAKLKTLLLAHKDCPVTKAMEQGNSIILGPKIISVSGEMLQTSSTPGILTGVKRASVISSELCDIPNKKIASVSQASLTTHNSQMILPKTSIGGVLSPLISKNGKIIRNRISGIKVIEEDEQQQIVTTRTEDKNKKQILIVKNHQMLRKSSSIDNFRQIIRINPNLEIDNAASKSTGS